MLHKVPDNIKAEPTVVVTEADAEEVAKADRVAIVVVEEKAVVHVVVATTGVVAQEETDKYF
jgi:3-hydroxyisobutyrate dehydrogenase-like beta-hydroxyacid dehydrogenase